ncbi:MAG: SET domain-containing protein-lysine N-methyltransferase [Chitinophagaceae bacterium]
MNKVIKTIAPKNLYIKRSKLPGAGKGLFTRQPVKKGTVIIEYKGSLTTWKKIEDSETFNGYVFYINRNNVIDAKRRLTALARYANDARGPGKVAGILNNADYITRGKKVFIQATKDIAAGGEILVSYGKEYWDVIRYNHKLSLKEEKAK